MEPIINPLKMSFDLYDAIEAAGHVYHGQHNGVHMCDNAIAVQVVIDAFDELPTLRKLKIIDLKAEGLQRVQVVFPAIENFDDLDLVREQWLSIAPAARQATTDFQTMIDIVQAGRAAAAAINALTVGAEIKNYDVVNTPAWP